MNTLTRDAATKTRRNFLVKCSTVAAIGAFGFSSIPSHAEQTWTPSRPIRLVVPFPPGGGNDVIARIVTKSIANKMGQPIVVENKAGAAGAIGSQFVAMAPPDGYTLIATSADTHSILPHVQPNLKFRARDMVPVSAGALVPYVLVARPDLPASTMRDVIELSKRQKLSFATWGAGGGAHVAMALVREVTKMPEMLHVPYSGAAPASQAVMASQVDLMTVPMQIAGGIRSRLKTIGTIALKRSDAMPDVPTLAEQGYPVNAEFWVGFLAPPQTPANIVAAFHEQFTKALEDPEVQKSMRDLGATPHVMSQKEFAKYYASEYDRWGAVIKAAGIKLD